MPDRPRQQPIYGPGTVVSRAPDGELCISGPGSITCPRRKEACLTWRLCCESGCAHQAESPPMSVRVEHAAAEQTLRWLNDEVIHGARVMVELERGEILVTARVGERFWQAHGRDVHKALVLLRAVRQR